MRGLYTTLMTFNFKYLERKVDSNVVRVKELCVRTRTNVNNVSVCIYRERKLKRLGVPRVCPLGTTFFFNQRIQNAPFFKVCSQRILLFHFVTGFISK